jgi:diguanylate cyclase (GGDEF)-like protein/PAS domain S-box-containing protein
MSGEDEVGFQFLAENSTDVICRAGLNLALHYASPASFQVLGRRPEEMIGLTLDAFVLNEDASALAAAFAVTPSRGLESPAVTVRMAKKDGTLAWMEIKHRVLFDSATGDPREIVIVLRDVADRKPLEERLSALALTDSLTGLSTHHAFLKALEREWNRALREGSPISLLLLDFNGFRQFHGLEGHVKEDSCLPRAAAAVMSVLRVTDLAARYGAEDIAIILPLTDLGGAARAVERLRSAIEPLRSARNVEGEGWSAVSIGLSTVIARSGGTMRMPEILLLAADHALHKAQHEEAESRRPTAADRSARMADWKTSMPGAAPKCA